MAAVSLFWDTNMAAVTSCENTLLKAASNTVITFAPAMGLTLFFHLIPVKGNHKFVRNKKKVPQVMNLGVVFYELATFLKYLGIQMGQCQEKVTNHRTLFSSFNIKHLVTGPSKFIKPRCNSGRQSFAGYSALLPSDVIDFAMLPAQRFWRETVSLLDVM